MLKGNELPINWDKIEKVKHQFALMEMLSIQSLEYFQNETKEKKEKILQLINLIKTYENN
jgi:hypothetical protein